MSQAPTGMFSNLMSFARGMANPQQNQNANQNQNQNQNQNANQLPGNQGNQNSTQQHLNQNQNNANNDQKQNQDPFELYSKIFEPEDPAKGPQVPKFSVPDEVLGKAAGAIDFTAGLPEDMVERLNSGESLDSKTIIGLLNHVGRTAYTKSLQHATSLTDRFVGLRSEFDKAGLNKNVQRVLATNSLSKLPGADNPVIKGFLDMTSATLADRYPDKSPEWVAEKTHKLFLDMAKAMTPQEQQQQQDQKDLSQSADFEWDKYLNT